MKNLTASNWWELLKGVTEEIYRELQALRRDRAYAAKLAQATKGTPLREGESIRGPFPPFLFGQVGDLECLAYHHYDPYHRPIAWVTIEFRLGPTQEKPDGRTIFAKTLEVWAQLPQARWSNRSRSETIMAGKRAPVSWKGAQQLVREAELEGIRADTPRLALVAQPLPIDPQKTPKEVTWVHLMLCLWQRDFIVLGPQESPDSWAFLKQWFKVADRSIQNEDERARADDAKLAELLGELRRNYVLPEDWRGLRKYSGKTLKTVANRQRRGTVEKSIEDEAIQKQLERKEASDWFFEQRED